MGMDLSVGITGLVFYGLLGILIVFMLIWSAIRAKGKVTNSLAYNVRHIFRVFVTLFVLIRLIWLSFMTFGDQNNIVIADTSFILNRAAILFFLTSFTLILFFWAERFHKNYFETRSFLPQLGFLFIITNVIIYIVQIILMCLWLIKNNTREGNPLYEATILIDVVVSLFVSIGFLIYGNLLMCSARTLEGGYVDRKKELFKILLITIVFTTCFFCRTVMFLYRPITKKWLSIDVFYCFAYFVPELIPSVFQMYLSESIHSKQEADKKVVDSWYAESDDEEIERPIIPPPETIGLYKTYTK